MASKPKKSSLKPGPWGDLFDPAQIEHACEAVRDAIVCVSCGEPSRMHEPLRRFVIDPAWSYVHEHWEPGTNRADVAAAYKLIDEAGRLAELFEDRHPFDDSVAEAHAATLRLAWLWFVAHGAGHYVYWVIPKRHEQLTNAAKGKRRGWLLYLSDDDVAAVVAECGPATTYETLMAKLADRARSNVPKDKRVPLGDPDAAAVRAYRAAVKSGRVRPRR